MYLCHSLLRSLPTAVYITESQTQNKDICKIRRGLDLTQKIQSELVIKVTEPAKGMWAFTSSISENLTATGASSRKHVVSQPRFVSSNFSLNKISGCCFSLSYGPPQLYFHPNLQFVCSFMGQPEKISAGASCVFKRLQDCNKCCSSFQQHRKKSFGIALTIQ